MEYESVLKTIRDGVGVAVDDTSFDSELILYINSAFSTLAQLGIGNRQGYRVVDETLKWRDILVDPESEGFLKLWMTMKTRMVFDPPETNHHLNAFKEILAENEYRMRENYEFKNWREPVIPLDPELLEDEFVMDPW